MYLYFYSKQQDQKIKITINRFLICIFFSKNGKFVKDLGSLYKDLSNIILLDNSILFDSKDCTAN